LVGLCPTCVSIPLQGLQPFGRMEAGQRRLRSVCFNPSSRITTFRTNLDERMGNLDDMVSIPLQGLQPFGLGCSGSSGKPGGISFNPSSRITTFRTSILRIGKSSRKFRFNPSSRITTFRTRGQSPGGHRPA